MQGLHLAVPSLIILGFGWQLPSVKVKRKSNDNYWQSRWKQTDQFYHMHVCDSQQAGWYCILL